MFFPVNATSILLNVCEDRWTSMYYCVLGNGVIIWEPYTQPYNTCHMRSKNKKYIRIKWNERHHSDAVVQSHNIIPLSINCAMMPFVPPAPCFDYYRLVFVFMNHLLIEVRMESLLGMTVWCSKSACIAVFVCNG